ncbi:DUF333 domain-containing protein [Ralstonia solanacearum]|uniref:putative hemolysin n=1 Tax=Ralstonia solanacearum TaxID=305 RepID=UPI000BE78DDB|nr:DUF333 domain-containing protein [Ralstonia solanacearum]ATJ88849.1 hypothetical protein CDC59_21850 [Ralstonia solanacearum]
MNRAVCFVGGAGQGRRGVVAKGPVLALAVAMSMGLAACSSPMPPWEPPRTTIQPAPQPRVVSPSSSVAPPMRPIVPNPSALPPVSQPPSPQESARTGTANPASAYCLQRGGQLEFSTRTGGGEVGVCVSPGGDECEEWAFLRGSCTW